MAELVVTSVSKSFGTKVLSELSLKVADGELVAILGASGAGKSTLLRLIAGFDAVDSGTISIAGEEISSTSKTLAPERRGVGIVPQDSALFGHLSVAQNIGFGLSSWDKAERDQRVNQLLELVQLSGFGSKKPGQLSGGQQQRVALARALAPRPKLVLLDEPFSALDSELRQQLREEVKRILKLEGATAILVTHDQEEALSLADKVAVLRQGKIVQFGTPVEIYNSPADVQLATFLGDSVLVDGEVTEGKVATPLGNLTPLNQVVDGQKGVVAIRSENFYLQPNPSGQAEVIGRVFFGHDAILEVRTGDLTIRARSNGPFAPEVGMRVTLWVRGSVNFYPAS